jgi:hypothetical protein
MLVSLGFAISALPGLDPGTYGAPDAQMTPVSASVSTWRRRVTQAAVGGRIKSGQGKRGAIE